MLPGDAASVDDPKEIPVTRLLSDRGVVSGLNTRLPCRPRLKTVRDPRVLTLFITVPGTFGISGKLRAAPRGPACRAFYEKSALMRDCHVAIVFLDRDLVAKGSKIISLRKLLSHESRYRDFYCQFESRIDRGTAPGQILEVAGAVVDRSPESVPHHVPEERDDVEQRALAARVGADQDVEAVERDVDVPKAAVVQRLYAANHRVSCSRYSGAHQSQHGSPPACADEPHSGADRL